MISKIVIFFLTIEKFHKTFGESQANMSSGTTTDAQQNESICDELNATTTADYVFKQIVVEWIFIPIHIVTFGVGLVGNALVCIAVYKNHSMRNVTNYYIVNLAVADFMVILICLPPTVVWDVTGNWFWGKALCKIVLYFQVSTY